MNWQTKIRILKWNLVRYKNFVLYLLAVFVLIIILRIPTRTTVIEKENDLRHFMGTYFDKLHSSIIAEENFPIGLPASRKFENIYTDISHFYLRELEQFDENTIEKLKQVHQKVVACIPLKQEVPYYTEAGYVTLGGGENDFLSYLLIKQLRNLGAKNRIEVIIPPLFEEDKHLCTVVFPELNACCVSMKKIFGKRNMVKLRYNTHLLQTLAIITSTFEHALFIAPSTLPLHNPEFLFDSTVYAQFNMIMWPSIYRSTISPSYYDVAGIQVGNTSVRVLNDRWIPITNYEKYRTVQTQQVPDAKENFHDLNGTSAEYGADSNLLLINKVENFDVLLLMLYYTNDGSSRYFSLLNLAKYKNNGDYITAAAHYLKKSYYQNFKTADKIGEPLDRVQSITGHYNPEEDYNLLKGQLYKLFMERRKSPEGYDYFQDMRRPFNVYTSTPLFFTVEGPGLNPFDVKDKGLVYDAEQNFKRIYGPHIKLYGTDFELKVTRLIYEVLCEEESKIDFQVFESYNLKSICESFLHYRLEFLEKTSDTFWNKYIYEKRLPEPVPDDKVSLMENIIKEGFAKDFDYLKQEIARK